MPDSEQNNVSLDVKSENSDTLPEISEIQSENVADTTDVMENGQQSENFDEKTDDFDDFGDFQDDNDGKWTERQQNISNFFYFQTLVISAILKNQLRNQFKK